MSEQIPHNMKKLVLPIALCFLLIGQSAFAQNRPVKGRVLDDKGEPLPGASVTIKGTKAGTITDVNGDFRIDVPDNDNTLVITALGNKPQEVTAGDGSNVLIVNLTASANSLGDVVITALGITKDKRTLGYSVSEVKSEQIEASGERNPIEALAGKAPGVQVTSSGGTPGASAKILLRGNSTFTGDNAPLIILDGMPIDNSTSQPVAGDNPFNANLSGVSESNRALDINPDDIASVSVLKGPAAAALYGARGANGAIIITTKKGKYGKGQGLGITVTSSLEINKVSKLPKRQNQYGQGDGGIFRTGNTPLSWGPRIDTTNLQTFDNYANFYQTGMGYNNTISLNGGNENSIFRISIGNYNTSGIIPNTALNKTTFSVNGETTLAAWLKMGAVVNYTHSESEMAQNGSNVSGPTLSLFRMPATYDVTKNYYDEGLNKGNNYVSSYDNPLYTVYRNPYNSYTNRVLGNTYLNADITKDLKATYKIGIDEYGTDTRQIYDINSRGNDVGNAGIGQINKSSSTHLQVYSDFLLTYTKKLGDFSLNGLLGYNYWYSEDRYSFLRGTNLTIPNFYNLVNATDLYASNSDGFNRSQAVFAELDFGYKSLLYLTLTGRDEWNTALGKNGKSFFYPNANLSWVFSEHINPNDILSFGKLRVAYANAGVAPVSYADRNYYAQPFLTDGFTNGNSFPYLGQGGYMPSNINFPGNLKPSNVTGKEIGLETRFWNNRINFEVTYYNQTSHDVILYRPVAPSSGFQQEYSNAGKIRNAGVELSLNADIVKTSNLTINIGGNWSKNKSKTLALAGGVDQLPIESGFSSMGSYAIVGQPYGVFYGSAWERNSAGQLLLDETGYPIVATQSENLGDPNPDWLMGLNGSVDYKGFSFSMLWDIRHGGKIWNGTWSRLNNVGVTDISADREHDYVVDGIYAPGTPSAGQKNTIAIPAEDYFRYVLGDNGGAAENAIQDGSWIRLRSVNLSYRYTFKKVKTAQNPFKYIEVGFTGRNLFLSTKYKGVDPETSLTGAGSNINGWDYFNNPGSKSYIFNLKFGL